jgi:type IV pilus assembly protein PilC
MKYKYRALDSSGKSVEGTQEAEDRIALVSHLRNEGYTPISIAEDVEAKQGKERRGPTSTGLELFGVSTGTVATFTRNFAELIETGVPVVQALSALQQFTPSPKLRAAMNDISTQIQQGQGLSDSMSRHPKIFPPIFCSLIRVGEVTGNLGRVSEQLADHLEKDVEVQSKVKGAMTYPVFILVFSAVLVWAMVAYLLPGFMPMWQQAGLDLHKYPVTVMLMKMSAVTHNIFDEILLLFVVAGLVYGLRRLAQTDAGQRSIDRALLRLPVLGNFMLLTVMARAAGTLGILLNSGVSLIEALRLTGRACGNSEANAAFHRVEQEVSQGKGLSVCLDNEPFFPPMFVQMVAIGEKSGQLGKMLPRVAKHYESQLDTGIKSFSSLIEPVMMVVVGGIVFVFIIGVFLPIMGVVNALQNQM